MGAWRPATLASTYLAPPDARGSFHTVDATNPAVLGEALHRASISTLETWRLHRAGMNATAPLETDWGPDRARALTGRLERKYADRIAGALVVPAKAGLPVPFPGDLPRELETALRSKGICQLYSHQLEAWNATARGENLVVVTPTASGKSLCYSLPVVASAMREQTKSLYLFPTKALAQDQVGDLIELSKAGSLGIRAATFDGDTPGDQRHATRPPAGSG